MKTHEGPLKNLPEWPPSPDGVAVLAISSDLGDHASLRRIFAHTRWRLFEARSCREAIGLLGGDRIGVVICDSILMDGSWKELLLPVSESLAAPLLIISSGEADDSLWAEVLNLGAYDVLSKPFDLMEVTRIVSLAWLHWKERIKSPELPPDTDKPPLEQVSRPQ